MIRCNDQVLHLCRTCKDSRRTKAHHVSTGKQNGHSENAILDAGAGRRDGAETTHHHQAQGRDASDEEGHTTAANLINKGNNEDAGSEQASALDHCAGEGIDDVDLLKEDGAVCGGERLASELDRCGGEDAGPSAALLRKIRVSYSTLVKRRLSSTIPKQKANLQR